MNKAIMPSIKIRSGVNFSSFFPAINCEFDHLFSSSQGGIIISFIAVTFLLVSPFHSVDRLHVPALGMILWIPITTIEQIRVMVNDLFDLITVKDNRFKVSDVFCLFSSLGR